jgi:hypothetical protein
MKFSKKGYLRNSPDVNKPKNIIQGGNITMKGVDFKVHGVDNNGYARVMAPGYDHYFPHAKYVTETPIKNKEMNGPFKMKPGRGNMPKTGKGLPKDMTNPIMQTTDPRSGSSFKDYNASDLVITDPVTKKYDGYGSNKTLRGRTGTNTTASGKTLFPGYSSESIGTYKKGGQTFQKIRPGAKAKSFGDYEKMEQAQNKRKINKGIDPIKASDIRSGKSRQAGTFKQYVTTERQSDKLPSMASNTFGKERNIKRQAKLDAYLEKKLFSK